MGRESIEIITIRTHEMREDRARNNGLLVFQEIDQLVNIVLGIKTESMHASIKFNMYWPACNTFLTGCPNKGIHQPEGIDFRFQVIVEHRLEGRHLRIHNHNVGRNTSFAECDTLIGNSHSQIIDTMILKRLGDLNGTSAIGIGLDHTDHLRIWLQKRAIVIQIVYHSIQVYLQDRLVDLLFQLFSNLIETETAGTFQQDQFVTETIEGLTAKEMLYIGKEAFIGNTYTVCLCGQFRTDTDEFLDTAFQSKITHLGIETLRRCTGLEDITEYQSAFLVLFTTLHKVERDIERIDIAVIGVVNQYTTTLALLHFQTHSDWFKQRRTCR